MTKLKLHLSLRGQTDPILRHGRSQCVAAHPLQSCAITTRHDHAGVQIESVLARVTPTEPGRRQRHPALDRGFRDPGQDGGLLRPRIRTALTVPAVHHPTPCKQPTDPSLDRHEEIVHLI